MGAIRFMVVSVCFLSAQEPKVIIFPDKMLIFVQTNAAMLSRFFRYLLIPVLLPFQVYAQAQPAPRFEELPLGAIRPEGWLRVQLRAQADGLTGHLDEVYPEVMGPDNAWLGGEGDAWERGPYWIDGLLPLAWQLDDPALKAKAQTWVEAILASQREDGYIGPAEDHPFVYGLQRGKTHDWWPKMVALKILKQYYMATGDARVIDCLTRYFRYQAAQLDSTPLDYWSDWGRWRGGDNLEVVLWLHGLTGEDFLLPLAEKIHAQTTDWTGLFTSGDIFATQGSVHSVNLAQGFKTPVVWWQHSRDEADLLAPKKAYETIRHTVGLPTGLWAGDEQLHFGDPSRGSELCTAVEMMFSLEEMLRITGDSFYADWLERVAYNALPAQVNADFTAKQYYQQVNQIACTRAWRPFSTPHDGTDTMFGTLNGYPCCLSNMHQGWPKLTQNLWYGSEDGGLAALVYAPNTVTATLGGTQVRITETTDYPFRGSVGFTVDFAGGRVRKAAFPLHFRVPLWCTGVQVFINDGLVAAGVTDGRISLERTWQRGDRIRLEFGMEIRAEEWFDSAWSLVRGPLVYALPLEEKWDWVPFEGRDRWYGDGAWEVTSDTKWNYCLMRDSFRAEDCTVNEYPAAASGGRSGHPAPVAPAYPWTLASAPVSITVPARELPHWHAYNGSVGPVAYWTEDGNDAGAAAHLDGDSPAQGTVTLRLIPYGCTTLRIAAFPTRIVPWDLDLRESY